MHNGKHGGTKEDGNATTSNPRTALRCGQAAVQKFQGSKNGGKRMGR